MTNLVVALLGSGGFIGRHVAQSCFSAGIPVVELQKWDGENESFRQQLHNLRLANPNARIVLVQAAWYSTSKNDYRTSLENNTWVQITKSILGMCESYNIVFAGLGSCLEKSEVEEDLYTTSKSEILSYLSHEFSYEQWIWFRIYYVYSTIFLKPNLVAKAAEASQKGSVLSLMTPHDMHDFIEVRDVADAIVHSLIKGFHGTIEIGTGRTSEVSFLIKSLFSNLKILKEESTKSRVSYQVAASVDELVKSGWAPKFSIP